jgi:hypothetical protein
MIGESEPETKSGDRRRACFEALVLRALWLLVYSSFGGRPVSYARKWRGEALGHLEMAPEADVASERDFPDFNGAR